MNLTLLDIETQNWNVRSNTKTVLWKSKKNYKKNFLEPDDFSDKQYFKNWLACNFFSTWLRTQIYFLNVLD